MPFLYETHCHCAQCSKCAHSTAADMVRAYHSAGYAGLVLTDHFIFGNTAVPKDLPWEERMHRYYDAYLEAQAEGRKLDFDVIFGIEHFYGGGKEILFYGIDLAFLLNNPDIPDISIDTLVSRVHAAGGIAIHAHPFRDRGYINRSFAPRIDLVDGIEIYNACNSPGEDRQALELAKTRDFILTSGGDIHESDAPLIGAAGILLPCRVRDGKEFAAALKARDYALMIHGNALEQVTAKDLP